MFNEFIDVAKIMREIKLSTSQKEMNTVNGLENSSTNDSFYEEELAWRQAELLKYRELVEEHKSIGMRVPKLLKFNRVSRGILKCTAKFINKASMVITKDQNIVNHNLLISVDRLRESTTLLQQEIEQVKYEEQLRIEAIVNTDIKQTSEQFEKSIKQTNERFNEYISEKEFLKKITQEQEKLDVLFDCIEKLKNENEKYNEIINKQSTLIQKLHDKQVEYDKIIEQERIENRRIIQRIRTRVDRINQYSNKGIQSIDLQEKPYQNSVEQSIENNDLYYKEFEERFRGSEKEIKNRLQVYIQYINKLPIYRCLDIGCGRGEWLELLVDKGYDAVGLDINNDFIERCRSKGLNVKKQDALSYLKQCKDNSFDMISGFHIIEHINTDELNSIIEECNRVLTPDGIIIFETPNPRNTTVGSCNFYLDSTHIRPVHPERIKFQLEYYGFYNIEYIYWQQQNIEYVKNVTDLLRTTELNPIVEEAFIKVIEQFNSPEDYGIVGRKA